MIGNRRDCSSVSIYHESPRLVTIKTGDCTTYDVVQNDVEDNWLVAADDEADLEPFYCDTRSQGVQRVLEHLKLLGVEE